MFSNLRIFTCLIAFVFGFTCNATDSECPLVTSHNDRRTNKNALRIMQYNVEWLFIDPYSGCPGNDCTWKNQSEAEIHMSYVADVIKTLNPDIVNMCEVEGCDELNQLILELNDETYLPYLKKGTDTGTGQNVGMISRIDPSTNLYRNEMKMNYPIENSKCGYYPSTPESTGVSKHYITEFVVGSTHIALISAHLIAIPTEPSRCSQREAQALILQTIIYDYIQKHYEIIMIGDFNDYDGETLDVNNNKPLSSVLQILKGYAGNYAGSYSLHSVAENIVQNERYSDWWDSDDNCNTASSKDYSMIDHVLVTEAINKNIINVFIYHDYPEYCGKYNSDHYPVVIDLMV
jgi:endonuclease/exonuclease/phosphatase family metal-dependent hydrolase